MSAVAPVRVFARTRPGCGIADSRGRPRHVPQRRALALDRKPCGALLQSLLNSIVQAYALLHETWPSSQKSALHLSILISVLSLANAAGDKKSVCFGCWVVGHGMFSDWNVSPSGCGCCPPSHHLQTGIRVLRVRLHLPRAQCRGLGVLFPSVPGATHELFQIRGVAFGGPLMWFVDFGIQLGLIRHVTEDRSKLPFAVANTVSPAEPLVQDAGCPILTAWPLLIVTITFRSGP